MVTIRDVAKECNLSISTVSRVLNYDSTLKVHENTKRLIFDTAHKLGYRKRTIKMKNHYERKRVGIVQWYPIDIEIKDPFYHSIRLGVETCLLKNNIEIIRSFKDEEDFFTKLKKIDGLICIGKFSKAEIAEFRKITDRLIFIDLFLDKIIANTIVMDVHNAMKDVVEYLVNLGHKKIGFLGGIEYTSDNEQYQDKRIKFFEEFCQKYNVEYVPYTHFGSFTMESGESMMNDVLNSKKQPTAIFCANDSIAIGALKAIKNANLTVPNDFSIVGFNNDEKSSLTTPSLTTINVPSEKMGEFSAQFMTMFLNQKKVYPMMNMVPCELIS